MIEHILHIFEKGFFYTWHLSLPYRLISGDLINTELLENMGELQHGKEIDIKFVELLINDDYLIIESLQIDHNARIVCWINMQEKTIE